MVTLPATRKAYDVVSDVAKAITVQSLVGHGTVFFLGLHVLYLVLFLKSTMYPSEQKLPMTEK